MNGPELRDIHLPAEPLWWPPAPGWWLLLALVLVVSLLFVWWHRRRRRPIVKRWLARELDEIRLDYRQGRSDARAAVNAVSRLLRRALIGYRGRRQGAASTGEAWLAQLAELSGDEPVFSATQLQWLAHGRYRRDADCDVESLLRACEDWIGHLPGNECHVAD